MRILPGRVKANQHLAFSPDGRLLACGGNARGLAVWDLATSAPPKTVLEVGHGLLFLHPDPNTGRLFAAFHAGGIWVWDPATNRTVRFPGWGGTGSGFIHGFAVSPDGRSAVVEGEGHGHETEGKGKHLAGFAIPEDGGTPSEVWTEPESEPCWGRFTGFAYRPGGDLFGPCGSGCPAGFVSLDPNARDHPAVRYPYEHRGYQELVGWAVSADGRRVAWTTAWHPAVRVRDLETGATAEAACEPGSPGWGRRWRSTRAGSCSRSGGATG